jgi:hypothetical protein
MIIQTWLLNAGNIWEKVCLWILKNEDLCEEQYLQSSNKKK